MWHRKQDVSNKYKAMRRMYKEYVPTGYCARYGGEAFSERLRSSLISVVIDRC